MSKKKFMDMTVIEDPDQPRKRKPKAFRYPNTRLRLLLVGMLMGTILVVVVGLLTVITHWGLTAPKQYVPPPTLPPAITPMPLTLTNHDPIEASEVRQTVSADLSADGHSLALFMWLNNKETALEIRHIENNDLAGSTVTSWQRMPFSGVQGVRFSLDNQFVLLTDGARLGWSNTQLHQVSTAAPLFGVPGGCAALSPDGRTLATCSQSELILWDVASRQQIQALKHPNGFTSDVAFSADGRYLAAVSYALPADFGVIIWDTQDLEVGLRSFAVTDNGLAPRIAFSPDGHYLAVTERNGVQMIDLSKGTTSNWNLDISITTRVAFSPDGQWMALSFQDPSDLPGPKLSFGGVWSIRDQHRVAELESATNDIRFSGDSRYLLVTHEDKSVELWDFQNNQVVSRLSFGS